jgi:hypothetical protein
MAATQYLPLKRGAIYILPEVTPGTYVAPTQASDDAIRYTEASWAWRGGPQAQLDDVTPFGGGSTPIIGATGGEVSIAFKLPIAPDTTDDTSHPLFDVLRASAMTVSDNTNAGPITVVPTSTFNAGTDITPASITILETDGDVWTLQGCTVVIDAIRWSAGSPFIEVAATIHGQCRDTLTDTVQTLSQASLSIASCTFVTESPVIPKGGTLTISGPGGSGGVNLTAFEFRPGQEITEQEDATETQGYGLSLVHATGYAALVCTVTKLDQAGRGFIDAMVAGTATTASLAFGTDFSIVLAAGRILSISDAESNGARAQQIECIGLPTSSGNDQFTLQWGS